MTQPAGIAPRSLMVIYLSVIIVFEIQTVVRKFCDFYGRFGE